MFDDKVLVSIIKGIGQDGFCLMSQILEFEMFCIKIGVLSGLNLVKEVVECMLIGIVIVSESEDVWSWV